MDDVNASMSLLHSTGRYLPLWRSLSNAPAELAAFKSQVAAFVGDEAVALEPPIITDAADNVSGVTAEDAIGAIVARSRGRRVVMLNEAHTSTCHRMFLVRVLRALRREGFDVLAAETFNYNTGSPIPALRANDQVTFNSGFYTLDPVYAEAAREALQLGYRLASYDADEVRHDRDSEFDVTARREQAQAANLNELLAQNPSSRFVVHAGYSHIAERQLPGGPLMFAARFQQLSGVDALTVQQAQIGSNGPHGQDNATVRAVLAALKPRNPIIAIMPDGNPLWASDFGTDLTVVHPFLEDIDGRPGWLVRDAKRHRLAIPLPEQSRGLRLAQAIHFDDEDPAIPADQYLIPPGAKRMTFYLRPGRYRLRMEAENSVRGMGTAVVPA